MNIKELEPFVPTVEIHIYLTVYLVLAPILLWALKKESKLKLYVKKSLQLLLPIYAIVFFFLPLIALFVSLFIDSVSTLDMFVFCFMVWCGMGVSYFAMGIILSALFIIGFPIFGVYMNVELIKYIIKK